jgi:hypothetical protein
MNRFVSKNDAKENVLMLRRFMILLFIGTCGLPVMAQSTQSDYSKFELFAGYSSNGYFVDESSVTSTGEKLSSFFTDRAGGQAGFEISLDRNFNRYIGLKGDFSSYFETLHQGFSFAQPNICVQGICTPAISLRVPLRSYYFTVGPEFKLRNRTRFTPFAHVLAGGVASHAEFILASSNSGASIFRYSDETTRFGFATSLGGGVDVRLTRLVSLRTVLDYTATFLREPNQADRRVQNHVRTSAGLVFHFH